MPTNSQHKNTEHHTASNKCEEEEQNCCSTTNHKQNKCSYCSPSCTFIVVLNKERIINYIQFKHTLPQKWFYKQHSPQNIYSTNWKPPKIAA